MAFKVRASSWGALFDCAHRWEGIHMLGMKSFSSLRAALGTAVHASTAAFDKSRMMGQGFNSDECASIIIDSLAENKSEWIDADLSLRNAQRIGINLHDKYCSDWSPKYNFVAVELTTKPLEIDCGGGIKIELCGTLDRCRVQKNGGKVGITDLKTGKAAVQKGVAKTKGHAAQVGVYEILYEHTTGNSITADAEIIGMSTSGDNSIATGKIIGAKESMIGQVGSPGRIEHAAAIFRSGLFYPNNQSSLCSEKYCPRWNSCKFKG